MGWLILSVLLATLMWSLRERGDFLNLSAVEAWQYIRQKRPSIIDVRTVAEQSRGRIAGATSLPLAELPSRLREIPHDRPILVYCASGVRSRQAAAVLSRAGCREVVNLIGGLAAWRGAGFKLS